jgi:hypothetical protein
MVNERGKVLDVYKGRDFENQNIVIWKKNGKLHQTWDTVFVSKMRVPKKGQLNEDFGIYVDRTFYIVS